MNSRNPRTDIILTITNDSVQQIALGQKNHEFRKSPLPASVQRIWFYTSTPCSHIPYICEINPVGRTRAPGHPPLPHDGIGNQQWNERHADWTAYDFAYAIRGVYKIREPVTLHDLTARHGMKGAPRGLVYVPESLLREVHWDEQERIISREAAEPWWLRRRGSVSAPVSRALSPAPMDIDMNESPLSVSRALKRSRSEDEFAVGLRTKRPRNEGPDCMFVDDAELMS